MHEPRSRTLTRRSITVRGLELSYLEACDPQAASGARSEPKASVDGSVDGSEDSLRAYPVGSFVAIHGFAECADCFRPLLEAISSPIHVVLPDLRGHGESGWIGDGGAYHFAEYVDDVLRIIDRASLDRFNLIGHSLGGVVATRIASIVPDRVVSLILLEGTGRDFESSREAPARLAAWCGGLGRAHVDGDVETRRRLRRRLPDLDAAVEKLAAVHVGLDRARLSDLAGWLTEPSGDQELVWRCDPLHWMPPYTPYVGAEVEAFAGAVSAPVLALYGERAPRPNRLAERHRHFNRSMAALIPDAGHGLHLEQPVRVAEEIEHWIRTGRTSERSRPLAGGDER